MVSLYMRFKEKKRGLDYIILELEADWCLSEAAILAHALDPVCVSMHAIKNPHADQCGVWTCRPK